MTAQEIKNLYKVGGGGGGFSQEDWALLIDFIVDKTNIAALQNFANDGAAGAGGLITGDLYVTGGVDLSVEYKT